MKLSPLARRMAAIIGLLVAVTLFAAAPAAEAGTGPQTYTVTRADDPVPGVCNVGDCSLREAVVSANTHPQSTILLAARTYTLTIPGADAAAASERIGDLDVRVRTTIQGVGAGQTIVQAGSSAATAIHRLFDISGKNVVLQKMTIQRLTKRGCADPDKGTEDTMLTVLRSPTVSYRVVAAELRLETPNASIWLHVAPD